MADPATILAILRFVGGAAFAVCEAIDKAIELEYEERQALKELRWGVESLRSDIMVYKVLLSAMENDTNGRSIYKRFIQLYVLGLHSSPYANHLRYHRQVGKEAMKSLERALQATRSLLENNPADPSHEVIENSSGSTKPRKALNFVLNFLKTNVQLKHRHEFIGGLKVAINEVSVCQQNNNLTFKHIWYRYVVTRQRIGRPSSVENIANIQDRVEQALDSVLNAFHVHPFAVSPEKDSRDNLPTSAILNHNHKTATRHEKLARQIGRAWVDDRISKYNAKVRDHGDLQTSLFELLWSGTVEQLKWHGPHSADDPERLEFERAVEELERALQEAIVRSKKQRFAIAFCGMVKAGKSTFLNALMGRAILPSDGESDDPRMPYLMLSIIAELPSTAWPCRIRHVEGQTVPELQFQAEPFLAALEKLQARQYGRKMQTYQPPPENMFEALLSGAPFEPLDEEILLRTIHSQWIDLHTVTRDNLLKFETPEFRLPRMASGEQNVKTLVSLVSFWTALFSTE